MTRRPTRDDMSQGSGCLIRCGELCDQLWSTSSLRADKAEGPEATGEPAMCLTISPRYWPTGPAILTLFW